MPWKRILVLTFALVCGALMGGPAFAGHGSQVRLRPSGGVVGTLVHFKGKIDPRDAALAEHGNYWLEGTVRLASGRVCQMALGASAQTISINRGTGRFHGRLRVGSTGTCAQSMGHEHPAIPGRYHLVIGCHVCGGGHFELRARSNLPFTGSINLTRAAAVACLLMIVGTALTLTAFRARR